MSTGRSRSAVQASHVYLASEIDSLQIIRNQISNEADTGQHTFQVDQIGRPRLDILQQDLAWVAPP